MWSRTSLLVAAAVLAAAGCAGAPLSPGSGAATPTPGPSQPAVQPPEPAGDIVLCELVTGADVAAISPYSIPFEKIQPESSLPQSCVYRFRSDDDSASIRIDLVDFASQGDAVASLRNHDQAVRDTYSVEPEALSGLGDAATWSASTPEDAGIGVVTGTRLLVINLGSQGLKASDAARRAAAISLAQLVLDRLR